MSFPYRKVLILGSTSGIGQDLAQKILSSSSASVIITGRRQDRLDEFIKDNEKDKGRVDGRVVDVTRVEELEGFVKDICVSHPDLDMIIFNSGIQRGLDFSKPDKIDLDKIQMEYTTNYLSIVHMVKYFLPHLFANTHTDNSDNPNEQNKTAKNTAMVFVTSGIALLPMVRCGNYGATKAGLHHLVYTMREQLADTNVKVVELLPPAVQTELHDANHQPDIQNGRQIGMPLADFTSAAWEGLCDGRENIPVGDAKKGWEAFEVTRMGIFKERVEKMKSGGK